METMQKGKNVNPNLLQGFWFLFHFQVTPDALAERLWPGKPKQVTTYVDPPDIPIKAQVRFQFEPSNFSFLGKKLN